MESIHNQLTYAWNRLDTDFRRDIIEPTLATTTGQFLDELDSKTNI